MASEANLGITKGQLAWLSEMPHQNSEFVGLPSYQTELKEQHRVTQIQVEEEGYHFKCNLVFFGFFAIVAASCATWLFLTQGQGGVISAGCLTALSTGLVITLLVMAVLTVRRQKALENQYEAKLGATVRPETILEAMQSPDVSPATIQTILSRLKDEQRKEFVQAALTIYDPTQKLSSDQEKIFIALCADSKFLEVIPQKGRTFALALLENADPEPRPLFDILLRVIGAPQSPEEATLLAKCPPTVLKRYSASLEGANEFAFKRAFLEHTEPNTPLGLVQEWLKAPTSPEEAKIFARHPLAVSAYLGQPSADPQFALKMLRHLPIDIHPKLVCNLLVLVGPPTDEGGVKTFYNKHPVALADVMSQNRTFAMGYLQFAKKNTIPLDKINIPPPKNEEIVSDARMPIAVAHWVASNRWDLEVIFAIFSVMSIYEQIEFLQELDITNPQGNTAVCFILHKLLTKDFVQQYDNFPETAIPKVFGVLLGQLGRWPDLVATRLFGAVETEKEKTDFGTENSLLQYGLFMRLFFQSMTTVDRQACIGHAAARLSQHGEKAITECTKWLMLQEFPKWLIPILSRSPDVLAQALCNHENDRSNLRGAEIVSMMTPKQLEIYEHKLMQHFLAHYEKMVFGDKKNSPGLTNRLIARLRYLKAHPEWANTDPKSAKRYAELSANAITEEFDFQAELMKTHPNLFDPYTVRFNDCTEIFPAYRLISLSPVFASRITSIRKFTGDAKAITLEPTDPDTESDFIYYLKTGELQDEADALGLSRLAHFYQMGHLSTLCTQALHTELNLTNYKDILQTAVHWKLWDILTICLAFISKHHRNGDIVSYSTSDELNLPDTVNPVGDFLRFGIRCQQLGIEISYQPGEEEVCTSPGLGGPYLSTPMGKRRVHISKLLENIEALRLQEFILPNAWSTENCEIALAINLGQTGSRLWPIFMQCAEETVPDNLGLILSIEQTMPLYLMASQQKKSNLVSACMRRIQEIAPINFATLKVVLTFAIQHQLPDLKCVCLSFISLFKREAEGCIASTNANNNELKHILKLGIECAYEEIGITYVPGEHHVLVKSFTEDNPTRNLKGNQDKVITTLVALHKIRAITHLESEDLGAFNNLKLAMGFLGKTVKILHKPRPL